MTSITALLFRQHAARILDAADLGDAAAGNVIARYNAARASPADETADEEARRALSDWLERNPVQ